jgi:amino acid transporter
LQASLKHNSVGLPGGAVVMSAAIMGPAVSTFFNPQFSTPFSGPATPFAYFACLVAILITASGIMEMAAEMPSAGSFCTYVAQGLGPHAGFVTGGLMFLAYALLPPIEVALIGAYLQQTIQQEFGINTPWCLISIIPWGFMTFLVLGGMRSSLRTAMVLFLIEVGVVMTMAIIVVYVLANIAAIAYFMKRSSGKILRHALLPALGYLLMIGLFAGQIVENTGAPYTWMPWITLC